MNRIKPHIYIIVGAALFLALAYKLAGLFAPGSYPYAQQYELNSTEEAAISAVNKFKQENPNYSVHDSLSFLDGRNDSNDLWYHVYFYDRRAEAIWYTWIRSSGNNNTTFALVSVIDGNNINNSKEINHDLIMSENEVQKKRFEEEVLIKIKGIINRK